MLEHLVIAGLLYLSGIAVMLTIKPRFMFTEEGVWKEFGIGRNPATHTWMPFWLFAILWALVCYILVTIALMVYQPSLPQEQPSIVPSAKLNKASLQTLQTLQKRNTRNARRRIHS